MVSPDRWGQEVGVSGPEGAFGSILVKELGWVWSQVEKGFIGDEAECEVVTLGDGEPEEFMKDRGDVVSGTGVTGQACSSVLDVFEILEEFEGCTAEDSIAVVWSRSNKCMDESLSCSAAEGWAETADVFEVEKVSFGAALDMLIKGEGLVEDKAEAADVRGVEPSMVREKLLVELVRAFLSST